MEDSVGRNAGGDHPGSRRKPRVKSLQLEHSPDAIAADVHAVVDADLLSAILKRVGESGISSFGDRADLSVRTLQQVAAARGHSAVLRAFHPAGDLQRFFQNLFLLSKLLPLEPFSARDLAELYAAIPREASGDMALTHIFESVRSWAVRYPGEGVVFVEQLLADDSAVDLAVPILEGLAIASSSSAVSTERLLELLNMLNSTGDNRAAAATIATPRLVAAGLIDLDDFLARLEMLIDTGLGEVTVCAALKALQQLAAARTRGPRFYALLHKAAADPRPVVRRQLASLLNVLSSSGEAEDTRTVAAMLRLFTDVDEQHHGLIHDVAWLLYSIAPSQPSAVIEFLRAWALRLGGGLELWHSHRFLTVFNQIPAAAFLTGLLEWLIDDDRLAEVAAHLLEHEVHAKAVPETFVQALDHRRLMIFVLVLSSLDHHRGIADLLVSTSLSISSRPDAADFVPEVESALAHAVLSFPTLLDALPEAESLPAAFREILGRLRRLVMLIHERRKRAAALRELRCPPDRMSIYNRMQAESTAAVIRRAEQDDPDRTPFYSMAKKVRLLAGGRSFMRHPRGFTPPLQLQQLTTTVELPRLPFLDPIAEDLRRFQIRQRLATLRQAGGG